MRPKKSVVRRDAIASDVVEAGCCAVNGSRGSRGQGLLFLRNDRQRKLENLIDRQGETR